MQAKVILGENVFKAVKENSISKAMYLPWQKLQVFKRQENIELIPLCHNISLAISRYYSI